MWFSENQLPYVFASLAVFGIFQLLFVAIFARKNSVSFKSSYFYLNTFLEIDPFKLKYTDEFFITESAKKQKGKYLVRSYLVLLPAILVWIFVVLPTILTALEF